VTEVPWYFSLRGTAVKQAGWSCNSTAAAQFNPNSPGHQSV